MRAREARNPVLRWTWWHSYATDDVERLLALVREAVPEDATDDVVVAAAAASTLRPSWRGYARGDVDFWRRRLVDPAVPAAPWWRFGLSLLVQSAMVVAAAAVLAAIGPAVLAVGFAAYLCVLTPLLGRRRFEVARYRMAVAPELRAASLVGRALPRWSLLGVLAILGEAAHRGAAAVRLAAPNLSSTWVAFGIGAILGLVASPLVLRRRLRSGGLSPALVRRLARISALLPRTNRERGAFALLSVTAGVVEELCYRGFLLAFVAWAWPGAPEGALVATTGAAFGAAHLYQGAGGMLGTGVLGAALAWLTLSTGSLYPAIVLHALVDLRMCFVPAAYVRAAER